MNFSEQQLQAIGSDNMEIVAATKKKLEIAKKLETSKLEDSLIFKTLAKSQEGEINVLKDLMTAVNSSASMKSLTTYCMVGISGLFVGCWLIKVIAARALMEP